MSCRQRKAEIVSRKEREQNRDGECSVVGQVEREADRWGIAQPCDQQNRECYSPVGKLPLSWVLLWFLSLPRPSVQPCLGPHIGETLQ